MLPFNFLKKHLHLVVNPIAQMIIHCTLRNEVDGPTKFLPNLAFDAHEVEETLAFPEPNEEIDITLFGRLTPSLGTK
jgi:hypothetical protein